MTAKQVKVVGLAERLVGPPLLCPERALRADEGDALLRPQEGQQVHFLYRYEAAQTLPPRWREQSKRTKVRRNLIFLMLKPH